MNENTIVVATAIAISMPDAESRGRYLANLQDGAVSENEYSEISNRVNKEFTRIGRDFNS